MTKKFESGSKEGKSFALRSMAGSNTGNARPSLKLNGEMKGKFESMIGGFEDDNPIQKEAPALKIAQSEFP